ncbi:cytochrome P450 4C1-like [Adelges cooleyi]|uniref:cytochrome P450 4C1-like n=1 Tax=Adelges cooleyi TaxID=133065 RepID=UPI0021804F64|nr:cytochrome P450 4C1-like [Adelges cooleyi]
MWQPDLWKLPRRKWNKIHKKTVEQNYQMRKKEPAPHPDYNAAFSVNEIKVALGNIKSVRQRIISKWLKYSTLKSLITTFYEETKVLEQMLSEKRESKSYGFQKKRVEVNEKAKTAINGNDDVDNICRKPKTLIEILLENEDQMSKKTLRHHLITMANVNIMTLAGHDTTAITNTIVIFMLAHHQDVQNNVLQEINSIFSAGDPNRPPTYEDLQKMEYLERVIKETMRLYPAAPILARKIKNEMMIGKYLIPADTNILIPINSLHLNPHYYKEPELFNPDNFLPEVCRSRHPYAYLPFSAGSRSCVGMKYAMFQMKTAISTLVRSFRFSPSEKCPLQRDLRITYAVVLKFVDGCYVNIESRT